MSSGVKVNDACKIEFNKIKMDKCYRYIIYKLSDDKKEIIVEKTAPRDKTYEDLQLELEAAMKNDEGRYVVWDAEYEGPSCTKNKLLFIFWAPDEISIKQKMVYSASKDAFQRELGTGISFVVHGSGMEDLQWSCILERINKTDRT